MMICSGICLCDQSNECSLEVVKYEPSGFVSVINDIPDWSNVTWTIDAYSGEVQ